MRFKGVRVDIEKAHEMKKDFIKEENELLTKIEYETNIRSTDLEAA